MPAAKATKKVAKAEATTKKAKVAKVTKVLPDKAKAVSGNGRESPIRAEILSFMRKGKAYTSREVVEGLGREPGNKGGGPVVSQLKKLATEGIVIQGEGEKGYTWTKK